MKVVGRKGHIHLWFGDSENYDSNDDEYSDIHFPPNYNTMERHKYSKISQIESTSICFPSVNSTITAETFL